MCARKNFASTPNALLPHRQLFGGNSLWAASRLSECSPNRLAQQVSISIEPCDFGRLFIAFRVFYVNGTELTNFVSKVVRATSYCDPAIYDAYLKVIEEYELTNRVFSTFSLITLSKDFNSCSVKPPILNQFNQIVLNHLNQHSEFEKLKKCIRFAHYICQRDPMFIDSLWAQQFVKCDFECLNRSSRRSIAGLFQRFGCSVREANF